MRNHAQGTRPPVPKYVESDPVYDNSAPEFIPPEKVQPVEDISFCDTVPVLRFVWDGNEQTLL